MAIAYDLNYYHDRSVAGDAMTMPITSDYGPGIIPGHGQECHNEDMVWGWAEMVKYNLSLKDGERREHWDSCQISLPLTLSGRARTLATL